MIEPGSTDPHGPLASVLAVRKGREDTRGGGLEHREALIYTLGKAAELEHLVMLQYLFAAFSLKQSVDEGLTPETLAAVNRWRRTLLEISEQEMLHLALVQNLLTAVGAAPTAVSRFWTSARWSISCSLISSSVRRHRSTAAADSGDRPSLAFCFNEKAAKRYWSITRCSSSAALPSV